MNESRHAPGMPVWHRNYYERVIRDMGEMNRIREYIILNPAQWANDENNPAHVNADATFVSQAPINPNVRTGAACCAPTTQNPP